MTNGEKQRYIVTAAPPNPNGDLHLGHLSGPYLGADVLRRYLTQRGHDVRYVSYADDFSSYVARRASELGQSHQYTAHVYGRRMEETLALARMLPDCFTHPFQESLHTELTQRFFLDLWRSGAFEARELPVLTCPSCRRHLVEAEVRGSCQHCGQTSDGGYCEACGRPQGTVGLGDPCCVHCGTAAAIGTLRRLVFPLEPHRATLASYLADRDWRPSLADYLDRLLAEPLPDVVFSRVAAAGIPVPLPGWDGHVLDTWFSGIWGYVAATAAHARAVGDPAAWEELWKDPETRVVQFLGSDCGFSHAVFWPALLQAHGGLQLPTTIVTNEFYRLEGEKFSTSRGHAIWGGEYLTRMPADAVRFYLCLTGPESTQTNFSAAEFSHTCRSVLRAGLQAWCDDLFTIVRTEYGGVVPELGTEPADPRLAAALLLPQTIGAALEPATFSLRSAAGAVVDAVEAGPAALALAREAPGGRAAAHRVAEQVEALAHVAAGVAPLLPDWSAAVLAALRVPAADPLLQIPPWPGPTTRLVPAGRAIAPDCPTALHALPR